MIYEKKVLCIGSVTADQLDFIEEQVRKQTIQPYWAIFYVDENPAETIDDRRTRIAHNHKKLEQLVRSKKCDYVWQVEGDSVLHKDTLKRLLDRAIYLNDNFAFITGAEVGRHGVACIGAWHVERDKFWSVDHRERGLVGIDACGWYCMLAQKDKWLMGKASWNGEPYGPDVVWGLSIKGNKYIDMDINVGHKTPTGVINTWDMQVSNATFTYDKQQDRWKFRQSG